MGNSHLERAMGAINAETRCPVVLLLDTSGSMDGNPIRQLNDGLLELETHLKADELVRNRVEVAIVTFGDSVSAINSRTGFGAVSFDHNEAFTLADEFTPPHLTAGGLTPMGEAMRRALLLIRQRKDFYKAAALDYYRPWILLITDGFPSDTGWESAGDEARLVESNGGATIYAVGVEDADMGTLARFSNRQPMLLNGLDFSQLFKWLSQSLAVLPPKPGDQMALPPVGWGSVQS